MSTTTTTSTPTATPASATKARPKRAAAASKPSRMRERKMAEAASKAGLGAENALPSAQELPETFDAFVKSLSVEQAHELEEIAAKFGSVDAREAEDAFEQGAWVERLSEIIPAEMTLSTFIETRCDRTFRSARQYRQVHRNLSSYRKVAVELRVHPTTLIELAAGTVSPEQVETVFEMYRAEKRPSVSAVKKYLKSGAADADADGPVDAGGVAGLGAKARERVSADVKRLVSILTAIGNEAFGALETHKGKDEKIRKVLAKALPKPARFARTILLTMISSPKAAAAYDFVTVEVDRSGRWGRIEHLLERMSTPNFYPEGRDATIWIAEEVLPAITWAIGKDPAWRSDLARKPVTPPALDAGDALVDDGEAEIAAAVVASPADPADPAVVGGNVIDFEPQAARHREVEQR